MNCFLAKPVCTEARLKIFECIKGFYNRERLNSELGCWSLGEFERAHAKTEGLQ